jgi:hypothetical protein
VTRGRPAKAARATLIRPRLNRQLSRACAREPKRDQDQPIDIRRFRIREQLNNSRSKRIGVDFEHRKSSQRQADRERRRMCSRFVLNQDPVGLDRLQSRLPVITRNGKPAGVLARPCTTPGLRQSEVRAISSLYPAPNQHHPVAGRACRASRHDWRRWPDAGHRRRANLLRVDPQGGQPCESPISTPEWR